MAGIQANQATNRAAAAAAWSSRLPWISGDFVWRVGISKWQFWYLQTFADLVTSTAECAYYEPLVSLLGLWMVCRGINNEQRGFIVVDCKHVRTTAALPQLLLLCFHSSQSRSSSRNHHASVVSISPGFQPACYGVLCCRAQQQKEEKKHLEDDLGEEQVRHFIAAACPGVCLKQLCYCHFSMSCCLPH